ncbi:PR domain zinc finger protein 4-like [Liolophura sinensis]|uniref:PR domain zinc finger protein 4-like n=1 Tax=Liolophura sinensis TaxID=3198878 RepID=UPI003158E6DA
MTDPLPTINIDQLTSSVTSVLASAPQSDYVATTTGTGTCASQPSSTAVTSPSLVMTHSMTSPITTVPLSSVPGMPLSSLPTPQSMMPVMVLAYVGGRPTLLSLTDQLTSSKFPTATSNGPQLQQTVHSISHVDSSSMIPVSGSMSQTCRPSVLPQIQPLPSQAEPVQVTNKSEQSIPGHILIQPKPTVATSCAPIPQSTQPVQSIPTSTGPPLPRALTPMTSQTHRMTPIDLQALLNQCVQSPVLTHQPCSSQTPSNNLLQLAAGGITAEHPVSQGEIPCMPPAQGLTSLPDPVPIPPLSQQSVLHNQVHTNTSAMMPSGTVAGSGAENSDTPVMMESQSMGPPPPGTLTVGDHDNTTEQTGLTNVQQLMTSLDGLSPVANSVCSLTGEYHNISVLDLLMKVHGGDLEKTSQEGMGKSTPFSSGPTPGEPATPSDTASITQFFCVECCSSSESPCKVHECKYTRVYDKPISTKARMTLPDVLYLSQSSVSSNLPGVWTKSFMSSHTVFGPVIGEPKSAHECDKEKKPNFFTWKIFYDGKAEGICVSDENHSNWMRFVKPARASEEQNVVVYQQGREIFFSTCRDLMPNQELLLWYSKDYAKALGMPSMPGTMATCNVCSKSFPNTKCLGQHVKYSHPDMSTRKYKCEYCGRGFNSSSKLKSHVLSHLGVKPYMCAQCGKKFTEKPNLTRHMFIHTGERKFACEVCGRGFRQKAHLQSHILVHTGERTIRCRYCEKLFARTSDLKQHEYQHTKEKVFTCPHCNKVFYKLQNFKKHSKIHSGQKDYPCHQCEKCFFTRYHMKRHLQTCKGTKGHYTLGPEDPEIVALNMDHCAASCEEVPTPPDPPSHNQKRTKVKGKGKK